MNKHVFLINGPPGSGKDEVAKQFKWFYHALAPIGRHNVHVIPEKFSRPLKEGMASFFDITEEDLEAVKNTPHFGDKQATGRVGQINLSEIWAKPTFGETIFGQLMVKRLRKAFAHHNTSTGLVKPNTFKYIPIAIISDSGFVVEAMQVVEAFGEDNVTLIRLYRKGTTYKGDSRSYIQLDGVDAYDVNNNETVADLREKVAAIVAKVLDKKVGNE